MQYNTSALIVVKTTYNKINRRSLAPHFPLTVTAIQAFNSLSKINKKNTLQITCSYIKLYKIQRL